MSGQAERRLVVVGGAPAARPPVVDDVELELVPARRGDTLTLNQAVRLLAQRRRRALELGRPAVLTPLDLDAIRVVAVELDVGTV